MSMKLRTLLLVPVIIVSGCAGCNDKNNDKTIPQPEPFTDDDPQWCEKGCAHLQTLPGQDGEKGCLEARPLILSDEPCQLDQECESGTCKNGKCTLSCVDFCKETIENGRFLGAECWTTVKNCEEIETVCRR